MRFRAMKVGADTALAQIVRLVEAAQNSKAPAQRLADRAAHYLTLVAVGSGVVTFLVWFVVVREPLLLALTFAVTAVVIACPDALGLATNIDRRVRSKRRARCARVFAVPTTIPRASATSAIDNPSTSQRTIAAR